jgi:citrate synthase
VESWKTGITSSQDGQIHIYGHDVASMMGNATFTDIIFLLHKGRLPEAAERRLFDAMLISIADHGPGAPSAAASRMVASANRAAPEAAVAAGILAIGDAHAGAGLACFEMIATALERGRVDGLGRTEAAALVASEAKASGQRIPGLGHRYFDEDPRTVVLFRMARELGVAGEGVDFLTTLESSVAGLIKRLPINVDGALAALLYDMGFTAPMAKFMFIIGRVAGLTAQVGEEYSRERPMRIRIPVEYDGPRPLDATSVSGPRKGVR